MDFKYFTRNGELRPMHEASVPLSNIAYQYGFGVYESIRVSSGVPFFLGEHIERLLESARIIGIEHAFDEALIGQSVVALIKKCGDETYNLKILLIGGKEPSLYILPLNPLFPEKKLYRDGADLITREYERPFPRAKSLNMLQGYLAYKAAREADCYDALLVNRRGCITEGTRTNFFLIEGSTLISPPEDEILLGVTRKAVLAVARKEGYELKEQDVHFGDLEAADGAFVTSTSSKILPVRSVDSRKFNAPPEALRELMRAYDAFLAACGGKLE